MWARENQSPAPYPVRGLLCHKRRTDLLCSEEKLTTTEVWLSFITLNTKTEVQLCDASDTFDLISSRRSKSSGRTRLNILRHPEVSKKLKGFEESPQSDYTVCTMEASSVRGGPWKSGHLLAQTGLKQVVKAKTRRHQIYTSTRVGRQLVRSFSGVWFKQFFGITKYKMCFNSNLSVTKKRVFFL